MDPTGSTPLPRAPVEPAREPATRHSLLLAVQAQTDRWPEFAARYRPLMLAIARDAGLNFEDAEDIAQNSFLTLFHNLRQLEIRRHPGAFRAFLRTVVNSRIRDLFRARSRRPREVPLDPHDGESRPEPITPDESAESLLAETVAHALRSLQDSLSPRDLQVLHSLFIDGRDNHETAALLGLSVSNVDQIKSRTKRRLYRAWLREYWAAH